MENYTDDQPLFTFAPTKGQAKKLAKTILVVTGVSALAAGAAVYVKKNPQVLEHVDESVHVES